MNEDYAPVAKMYGFEVVRYTCEKVFAPLARAAFNLDRPGQKESVRANKMNADSAPVAENLDATSWMVGRENLLARVLYIQTLGTEK